MHSQTTLTLLHKEAKNEFFCKALYARQLNIIILSRLNCITLSLLSGILAFRDQKGFGECLEYRKSSTGILQITPGCRNRQKRRKNLSNHNVTLSFQGSCQEALMDAHAVSNANSFIKSSWPSFLIWSPRWMCLINFFYSVLTVMTMAILINV